MKKPTVIVICGPTASGKTALSIELAKRINGEIVSEKVENNFSNGIKNSTLKRVVFTINGEEEVLIEDNLLDKDIYYYVKELDSTFLGATLMNVGLLPVFDKGDFKTVKYHFMSLDI